MLKAEVRDTDVGQHEEIGNDAAPDPVPFQFSDDRHADSRFYQPPQPGPSQPSVLSDYKQVPVTVPEGNCQQLLLGCTLYTWVSAPR